MRAFILIAIVLTFLPTQVQAHALGVAYKIKGDTVEIEAYYEDDSPGQKAKVSVVNEKNDEIAKGVTDKDGKWSFKTPAPGKYEIRVDAGAGHRAKKAFRVEGSPGSVEPSATPEATRDEETRTPWEKVGIGLSAIAIGSVAFFLAMRRPPNQA